MKARKEEVSIDFIKELLSYDEETGNLIWNVRVSSKSAAGSIAGWNSNGYMALSINKTMYYCHRIAWAIYYGEWPSDLLDHINTNKSDNRISNLRIANTSQNAENKRNAQSNNKTSGLLGVHFNKKANLWSAQLVSKGKHFWLGSYQTAEEASLAYINAKRRVHQFGTI